MQLLLKDKPVLDIQDNGICTVLDFSHLPFALRKEEVTLIDFMELKFHYLGVVSIFMRISDV